MGTHGHGGGQPDEGDVIVDGAGVPLRVGEDLKKEVNTRLGFLCSSI